MRGLFITFEGGEGAGKSTMMDRAEAWLVARGHRVTRTREPGGTELAERLRDILLDRRNDGLSSLTELLLVFASRAEHLAEVIRPALKRGETVLCDRFTDATWAYQGGGRELPSQQIAALEDLVHGDLQPDLTLLLDLPVEVGMKRAARRSAVDRIESEPVAFFERVRNAYLERAKTYPDRFIVVDSSPDMDQVWKGIEQAMQVRLG